MQTKQAFADVDLGRATAEQEGVANPNLLLAGFLDPWNLQLEKRCGERFLVLGYKGAGKSAVAEHYRLRSETDPMFFCQKVFLSELPFADFPAPHSHGDSTELNDIWRFGLMVELISSFAKDEGADPSSKEEIASATRALQSAGLSPSPGLPVTIRTTVRRKTELTVPNFGGVGGEREVTLSDGIDLVGRALLELAGQFRSDCNHVVFIDGLDDLFVNTKHQMAVLGSLLDEAVRINHRLHHSNVGASIVLLFRTDIFERLPSPNKNKVRQDHGSELTWYHNIKRAQDSKLLTLARRKALVTDIDSADIFADRLPPDVYGHSGEHKKPLFRYLLERTRHSPRDILRLLHAIQRIDTNAFSAGSDEIRAGAAAYSVSYFLPEVKDGLSGYFDHTEIEGLFKALGQLRRSSFSLTDSRWLDAVAAAGTSPDLATRMCEQLFETGALGVIQSVPNSPKFYTFKYRNPHASFDPRRRLQIHRGLHSALSIPNF